MRTVAALLVAVLLACLGPAAQEVAQAPPATEAQVDAIFARWTASTPGCAVGVARDGHTVLAKAYGMADLEHDARNTAETIFEAGSVSKQFTAAAVLLLARDGKVSLDDPVRKYIPELPDYGAPLTIRHMLTHTSGLRDWGSVAAIGGWPRTTRVYTLAHVLDIVSRQRALNFTPGTNWSYSNTGYNLAAILVARVSGLPFAEFCRQRLFEPLGLAHTSWRDDHTRVVKGRAIAYAEAKDGFHLEMPFENVHGNGGLLTTIGDLLRWNEHFEAPGPEDAALVREQQVAARVSSGQAIDYALGLYVRPYRGIPEVGHSGATAGYRAYLARYPGKRVSVAVLCNAGSAPAERYAHAVADLYLGLPPAGALAAPTPTGVPAAPTVAAGTGTPDPDGRAGMYRNTVTGQTLVLVSDKEGRLRIEGGPSLVARGSSILDVAGGGRSIDFVRPARPVVRLANGLTESYERVDAAHPTAAQLLDLVGTYVSDEAEVQYQVVVQKGELQLRRRPNTTVALTPLYADAFSAPGLPAVRFIRQAGRVTEMSFGADRVWDLRLRRTGD